MCMCDNLFYLQLKNLGYFYTNNTKTYTLYKLMYVRLIHNVIH